MTELRDRGLSYWLSRGIRIGGSSLAMGLLLLSGMPMVQAQSENPGSTPVQRRRQPMVFGVVQSVDNAAQWQGIRDRLQAAGIEYRIVDWAQFRRAEELGNLTVLLLPSVATISSEQALALQSWMNRGGQVIATGETGSRSSPGVQQALQSLLGAYWLSRLAQPAVLQRATNDRNQGWLAEGAGDRPITGGELVPSSLASQTVMVWDNVPRSGQTTAEAAAIVVTQQATFLGWQWGDSAVSSPEGDVSWLKAAVTRIRNSLPLLAPSSATPSQRAGQTTGSAPERPPEAAGAQNSPQGRLPDAVRPGSSGLRLPAPMSSQDPAERVAPPGLPVEQSTLPITAVEAIAMRQELENLMGRFESAVLAADAIEVSPDLAVEPSETKAADSSTRLVRSSARSEASSQPTHETLQKARQGLAAFRQLVEQRNYRVARQQWLATQRLLWENFPTDRPFAQPEIRAMWMDRGTIVQAGSKQRLAVIFDQLAAAGINTVFFETVNAGYPIYPSQVAPAQNPLTRQWDPLAAAVELAHERGMELHAWVWTFAGGNRAHNPLVGQPLDYPGPLITAHPEWANYDNQGSMIPPGQGKPFLDPANPAVRGYLLQLFEEIVTRYDVDGLQLDYIRYPFQDPSAGRTYGYGLAAREQFKRLTGVDPVTLSPRNSQQRQLWQQWTAFRTDLISSFVAETSQLVHRLNPELILSTAVFAMPEHQRIQELQQNWEVWARAGDVDMITLMSYAMDTNRLQRLTHPWLREEANLGSALVLPGIRLLNLSNASVVDQIQALRDSSSGGYALFATENLGNSLQAIFNRTQGERRTRQSDPIPYRQPFATAVTRYRSLLQEWSLLLSRDELWLRGEPLQSWRSQAESLRQALEALDDQPDAEHLQAAKQQIRSFRAKFPDWMQLQSLNHPYRVQTWENRLVTLEELLNYGERFILSRENSDRNETE